MLGIIYACSMKKMMKLESIKRIVIFKNRKKLIKNKKEALNI